MKVLYLVRGLPGSGKSTIAAKLSRSRVYEADQYFYVFNNDTGNVEYKFNHKEIGQAHKNCQERVRQEMEIGKSLDNIDYSICVSNTFTQKWEAKPYIEMAKKYGYQVVIITVQSNFKNVHNVPEESIQRMKNRWEHFTLEDFE